MTPRFLSSRAGALLALLLLASLTLFFGLGRAPFFGPDEPRYAEIAREMWVSGDYISPRLAGRLWLEKAPLLYWGQALCYSFFGANELAARLPSAFGALFLVLGLWACARHALGERIAFFVAIVAASMVGIIAFAHGASTDMTLCATLGGALLCLWRASASEKHALGWNLGAAAFTGGAMLAKGLIGPLLVLLIGGVWWIWARPASQSSLSQRLMTFLGALGVFFAVSAIWYWPVWARHGEVFWQEFFVNHHFKRFTSNEYKHPQPFYFFLFIALAFSLPWTPWLFPAAREIPALRPRSNARDSFLAFAWVWAIVPIVFFSISESKLPSYILPSFPALAIVAGQSLARGALLPSGWKPKWVALGGASLMALIVVLAFAVYAPLNEKTLSDRSLVLQVAAQMKAGETATTFRLPKAYAQVFYLQGRVVPGKGKHDTFVAENPEDLLPLLQKGSLIVFCAIEDGPLLEANPTFSTEFLGEQHKLRAYRLTLR